MLDNAKAPGVDDHTFGETFEGNFGEYYATPMLSGYVEPLSNNDSDYQTTCVDEEPVATDFHDQNTSACTAVELRRWLDYEYS